MGGRVVRWVVRRRVTKYLYVRYLLTSLGMKLIAPVGAACQLRGQEQSEFQSQKNHFSEKRSKQRSKQRSKKRNIGVVRGHQLSIRLSVSV